MRLSVVHFNHKLRGAESDEGDAAFVRQITGRRACALPFSRAEFDVVSPRATWNKPPGRLAWRSSSDAAPQQAWPIESRWATRVRSSGNRTFRILRGSGLTGLAGIYPVTAEGFVRPLIDVTRAEVEEYLRSRQIPWREDAMNRDPRFARNRIRHELLPQLSRDWNPRIAGALAHLADLAHEEERWWNTELAHLVPDAVGRTAAGEAYEVRADRLAQLPRALARRVIRNAIGQVKGDLRQIDFQHVETVLELAARSSGEGRARLPGAEATRSFDWIRLARPGNRDAVPGAPAAIPGIYPSPDGLGDIHLEIVQKRLAGG